jgi:hypothetical protein
VQLVCPARGGSLAPQQVSGDLLSHLLGLAQADLGECGQGQCLSEGKRE